MSLNFDSARLPNPHLSADHAAWRELLRRFVDTEIMPFADQPNPGDIAMLKVQASETLEFCAREAMQILGGAGYLRGNRVERIYREVRVNAIGGGSEEIMRDLAARQYGV